MIQVFRETLYFPTSLEIASSIDVLNGGGAAVVWTETLGQSNLVRLNIFNTPEEPKTGALDVNNLFPSFGLFNISVAALAGGGFVVVWQSGGSAGALGDIRFRVFDETGATQPDSQVLAHPDTADIQSYPTVVATEDGGFVIGWTDQSGTRDDPGTGSFAREFHASGIPVDEPFLLNTSTIGDQTAPRLAFGEGQLAAVWNSFSDSAAVLVDSPFFQVFDMQAEAVTQGLPDGFAPPDLLSQLSLDDGSSISVRAVPVGSLFTDWFFDHRDADGEILYSQQLINTRGASHMVLNADGIISVSLEQLSRTTPSTLFYDPASLSPLPYFQLEGLRNPSDTVIFPDDLISTFSDIATVRIDGRRFGLFEATSQLLETATHLQGIGEDGQPVGMAIGLPIPPEIIQAVFATKDGQIVLFVPGMPDNPTGYLTISPPSNGPPVATDPDGDTLCFTMPDAPTDTEIDDTGRVQRCLEFDVQGSGANAAPDPSQTTGLQRVEQ